jgi:hypothetical protein
MVQLLLLHVLAMHVSCVAYAACVQVCIGTAGSACVQVCIGTAAAAFTRHSAMDISWATYAAFVG